MQARDERREFAELVAGDAHAATARVRSTGVGGTRVRGSAIGNHDSPGVLTHLFFDELFDCHFLDGRELGAARGQREAGHQGE